MGHFGEVVHEYFAGNGLPHGERESRTCIAEGARVNHAADRYQRTVRVRYLNAHSRLARYGRNNSNPLCRQFQCNITFKADNPANLHPSCRNKFVQRDDRPRRYADANDLDVELQKRIAEEVGIRL